MKNKMFHLVNAGLMALSLTACLSAVKINLERKIADEEALADNDDLKTSEDKLIDEAPDLTDSQRQDLKSLYNHSKIMSDSLKDESLKLRSLLVKDLVAENYDPRTISLIKKKLEKNSEKKLDLIFKTLKQSNSIMGRTAKHHKELVRQMLKSHYID